ncbi:hypothetical protein GUJ93_ZPchr0006g42085 [Zizania palustris]|uniref:Uncharacterized protein n=1 Tax=Zizania palustris TaxID=103762 RepID=A0A8J5SN63_ZIZPA|nr:hypothetical protein GUJ93_ZPchr0006g42085 [Zizania palustris]
MSCRSATVGPLGKALAHQKVSSTPSSRFAAATKVDPGRPSTSERWRGPGVHLPESVEANYSEMRDEIPYPTLRT